MWFADYPPDHATDLRGRFRNERAGAHLSAWWELYLHRLFTCLGYRLDVHPQLPDSPNQPDFMLGRERERVYVEAAVVFSGIVSDEGQDAVREGWVVDALNKHYDPNFMLHVEFDRVGRLRPRERDVSGPVATWLASLDPDTASGEYDRSGELHERSFSVGEWQLRVRAVPVDREARGLPRRLVGVGPSTTGQVDDKEQLRASTRAAAMGSRTFHWFWRSVSRSGSTTKTLKARCTDLARSSSESTSLAGSVKSDSRTVHG